MSAKDAHHVRVAIIGAGFAGIGLAIRLLEDGVRDFVILERAGEVGGVWRDNTYPGCACDVPSHLYSLSFAPNPSWSRAYSRQPEILQHLKDLVERFGLRPFLRLSSEVTSATWEEGASRWRVETSGGAISADVVVAAPGALSEPSWPKLEGLERFRGKVMHSARWDREQDLRGRRVAVVGTGASAIQIIPEIQPVVSRLAVFQRTPAWVMPRRDAALSPLVRWIFQRVPLARASWRVFLRLSRELLVLAFRQPRYMRLVERLALRHLERSIPDAALREKLTPRYTIGCKRILLSDDYFAAFTKPNVELVTEPIREVRASSVVSADGTEREVDVIVLATGFDVVNPPIAKRVFGRGGTSLAEAWEGSPKAHVGTTIAGFPSFFLLQGPNTGLGHSSVLIMIESQMEHVIRALRFMRDRLVSSVEPRPEAQRAFVSDVDERMRGTVWLSGCVSWYLDDTGRNWTLWPGTTYAFERRVARFDPAEYDAVVAPAARAEAPVDDDEQAAAGDAEEARAGASAAADTSHA